MSEHSPGPWMNEGGGHIVARHNGTESNRFDIAKVFGGMDDEGEANSRLIAAAPDLLAACREALAYLGSASSGETQDALRLAIAAATGEAVAS